MKEGCHTPALRGQTVVLLDRRCCLVTDDGDIVRLEKSEGRWRGFETTLASSTQDDDVGPVLEQLREVGRLNTRLGSGARLVPVPRPASARPELRVSQLADAFDLDRSPSVATDPR
jgi:hypothetical protein